MLEFPAEPCIGRTLGSGARVEGRGQARLIRQRQARQRGEQGR